MTFSKIKPVVMSIEEMQSFDRWAVKIGISPLVLMENAGRAVAQAAREILSRNGKNQVAIFAGPGNNGGDGFVAGRYLSNWGIKSDIFLIGKKEKLKNEAKINFDVLLNLRLNYRQLEDPAVWQEISKNLKEYDLIIDAILGTGLKKPIKGLLAEVIMAINQSGRPVIAVDIPSGMNGNTGEILGCAVRANQTVTMAATKKGFLNSQARAYLGEVKIAELGIAYRKVNK